MPRGAATSEVGPADTEMAPAGGDLEQRISEALYAVANLEAVPGASRDLFNDFGERFGNAHAARDALFQERCAAKLLIWRLKGEDKAKQRR